MKSKKTIASVLTAYYIIICLGVSFTLHFCGGTLESFSTSTKHTSCEVAVTKSSSCCATISKADSDCCDNTVVDLSDIEKESLLYEDSFAFQPFYLVSNYSSFLQVPLVLNIKETFPSFNFQGNAPPLYKLYSTYIHYA